MTIEIKIIRDKIQMSFSINEWYRNMTIFFIIACELFVLWIKKKNTFLSFDRTHGNKWNDVLQFWGDGQMRHKLQTLELRIWSHLMILSHCFNFEHQKCAYNSICFMVWLTKKIVFSWFWNIHECYIFLLLGCIFDVATENKRVDLNLYY